MPHEPGHVLTPEESELLRRFNELYPSPPTREAPAPTTREEPVEENLEDLLSRFNAQYPPAPAPTPAPTPLPTPTIPTVVPTPQIAPQPTGDRLDFGVSPDPFGPGGMAATTPMFPASPDYANPQGILGMMLSPLTMYDETLNVLGGLATTGIQEA